MKQLFSTLGEIFAGLGYKMVGLDFGTEVQNSYICSDAINNKNQPFQKVISEHQINEFRSELFNEKLRLTVKTNPYHNKH